MYIYIHLHIYAIMKRMCPPGYHHNGFVATHALWHMMYGSVEPYIKLAYIFSPSCFCEIWALCVSWITYDYLYHLSLILSPSVMITLKTSFNRFSRKPKALSDGRVVSMTKNGSAIHFLYSLLNSSKLISAEWLVAISWSSLLFGMFMKKKCVVFTLTSFATWKYDCVVKTKEIFSFQPQRNNSVTTEWSFLLLIISAIISPNTFRTFLCFPGLYSSILLKTSLKSSQYFIKALGSSNRFWLTFWRFSMRYSYSACMDPWHAKRF